MAYACTQELSKAQVQRLFVCLTRAARNGARTAPLFACSQGQGGGAPASAAGSRRRRRRGGFGKPWALVEYVGSGE